MGDSFKQDALRMLLEARGAVEDADPRMMGRTNGPEARLGSLHDISHRPLSMVTSGDLRSAVPGTGQQQQLSHPGWNLPQRPMPLLSSSHQTLPPPGGTTMQQPYSGMAPAMTGAWAPSLHSDPAMQAAAWAPQVGTSAMQAAAWAAPQAGAASDQAHQQYLMTRPAPQRSLLPPTAFNPQLASAGRAAGMMPDPLPLLGTAGQGLLRNQTSEQAWMSDSASASALLGRGAVPHLSLSLPSRGPDRGLPSRPSQPVPVRGVPPPASLPGGASVMEIDLSAVPSDEEEEVVVVREAAAPPGASASQRPKEAAHPMGAKRKPTQDLVRPPGGCREV